MVEILLLADATKSFEPLKALEGMIDEEELTRERLKVVSGMGRAY
jgi:hypothetical protein